MEKITKYRFAKKLSNKSQIGFDVAMNFFRIVMVLAVFFVVFIAIKQQVTSSTDVGALEEYAYYKNIRNVLTKYDENTNQNSRNIIQNFDSAIIDANLKFLKEYVGEQPSAKITLTRKNIECIKDEKDKSKNCPETLSKTAYWNKDWYDRLNEIRSFKGSAPYSRFEGERKITNVYENVNGELVESTLYIDILIPN